VLTWAPVSGHPAAADPAAAGALVAAGAAPALDAAGALAAAAADWIAAAADEAAAGKPVVLLAALDFFELHPATDTVTARIAAIASLLAAGMSTPW
jgi:hypothetical protein